MISKLLLSNLNPFAALIGYCGTRQFGTGHSGTITVHVNSVRVIADSHRTDKSRGRCDDKDNNENMQ